MVVSPKVTLALNVTVLYSEPILCLMRFSRTAILRHRASDYDLEMKNDGFVLVADLLKLSKKTPAGIALSSHSEEDVRKVTFFFCYVHIPVRFYLLCSMDDCFYDRWLACHCANCV
jgi:hypothetical protein